MVHPPPANVKDYAVKIEYYTTTMILLPPLLMKVKKSQIGTNRIVALCFLALPADIQ